MQAMHEMITCRKTCTEVDLLLRFGSTGDHYDDHEKKRSSRDQSCDEFQCKTCGRWFSSFQALGGHRTSHKIRRRRRSSRGAADADDHMMMMMKVKKAKTSHECSVCGAGFEMGQALGGHMRRHKPVIMKKKAAGRTTSTGTDHDQKKKLFFSDLNLFPWENDHLLRQDHACSLITS